MKRVHLAARPIPGPSKESPETPPSFSEVIGTCWKDDQVHARGPGVSVFIEVVERTTWKSGSSITRRGHRPGLPATRVRALPPGRRRDDATPWRTRSQAWASFTEIVSCTWENRARARAGVGGGATFTAVADPRRDDASGGTSSWSGSETASSTTSPAPRLTRLDGLRILVVDEQRRWPYADHSRPTQAGASLRAVGSARLAHVLRSG